MYSAQPLILASASPRRRRLLGLLGLPFEVVVSEVDERLPADHSPPCAIVERLSLLKADAVAERRPDAVVLGADTIVVLDGRVLGKPADASEARRMLRRLSGRTHEVYTGFALVRQASGLRIVRHASTRVTFAPLDDDEIEAYVRSGSPLDKAGAYGIQEDLGAVFVRRIEGDYYTVVGLPMQMLYTTLRATFGPLPAGG